MKVFKWSILIPIIIWIFQIRGCVITSYEYENQIGYAWNLADKSSTISEKSKYITEFVNNLQSNRGNFSDYNAVFLKTPDNSFDRNLTALKTLQTRLKEIQGMNPNSFEYQVAIQQITSQEQGEAVAMLGIFHGCYFKENCWYCWNWYMGIIIALSVIWLIIVGFVFVDDI